ncbi:FAD-dependent pyridine nucleotide-disulfide oxidoreductase [Penicillium mononematosum]|uniref:FAD-dependent pyridine nucleotide-disulfide oxidoreductase n=1 Tax=Penicillium mononematosum TaxID=268346 RepID=UPI002547FEFA|nr:FAD-dependent pyridine nucleotide-disulfide oxidoreductase [Penicillium mononematosum]KAJ6190047.1 FAD-dependent pyridine nucleotide-disulfide oxidoreductase [Penicillium mononematosum]
MASVRKPQSNHLYHELPPETSVKAPRGPSTRDRATISPDIIKLRAAFNLLKRANQCTQENATSNSTACTSVNAATTALAAHHGRVLRERDTRELQRVAQQGRTRGRSVQNSLVNVNNLQDEVEAILNRMKDHLRRFR